MLDTNVFGSVLDMEGVTTDSPPGTGGVAAPSRKCCGATFEAQTGWSFPNTFRGLTTPSAPTLVAFGIILFDGAATPPLQGGEYVLVQHSFHTRAYSGRL